MELTEQMLTFDQVQLLTDLKFDVEKYSSMCFLFIGDNISIMPFSEKISDFTGFEHLATMTTADIIDVLPKVVNDPFLDSYQFIVEGDDVMYRRYAWGALIPLNLDSFKGEKLIEKLFHALVWCIENKYITL